MTPGLTADGAYGIIAAHLRELICVQGLGRVGEVVQLDARACVFPLRIPLQWRRLHRHSIEPSTDMYPQIIRLKTRGRLERPCYEVVPVRGGVHVEQLLD